MMVFATLAKVCLGALTLSMLTALYFKVDIIASKRDPEIWNKKYAIWMYLLLIIIIVGNFSFGIYLCVIGLKDWKTYVVGHKFFWFSDAG